MSFSQYDQHDGVGLGTLVRNGEVSPRELVDEALRRVDGVNERLNAVIHRMDARARRDADAHGRVGPFAGVPLLVKDLVSPVEGEPFSSGARFLRDVVPDHDSHFITRLRTAGFVIIGKTSTPEFGILPVTEPELFGPTRNPWNPEHTPGGSSGASAAAVAAGIVPLATGGDGGGSIRIPAACCGLFGLKPSRGRNPTGPDHGELWQGCAGEHVLTRSVRDSAAVLDATSGPDAGAPYEAPPHEGTFSSALSAARPRLRIAFTRKALMPTDVHPDCVSAVEHAAKVCAELGHVVEEAHPDFDAPAFSNAFLMMMLGETAAEIREAEVLRGCRAKHADFEAGTWLLALLGERYTAGDFALAARVLRRTSRVFAPFFARYDVLLTPTLGKPPLRVGELLPKGFEMAMLKTLVRLRAGSTLKALGALKKLADDAWSFAPFTAPFNASGQPAMNVPLHWNAQGLPIGTHFVGRYGAEATLLSLAAELEEAQPWAARRPSLWSGR